MGNQKGHRSQVIFRYSCLRAFILLLFSFYFILSNLSLILQGFAPGAAPPPGQQIPDEFLPPNNILFLQNLPENVQHAQLVDLFQQHPGFREVRMIPTKRDIAFVEYEDEALAAIAKAALGGHEIEEGKPMKVTFARK